MNRRDVLPDGNLSETQILAALLGISEMVASLTDLDEVLGTIVRITPQLVGVDRCAIMLYDDNRGEFQTAQVFSSDDARNTEFQRLVLKEEDVRKLAHKILEQKLPALVKDAEKDGMLPGHVAARLGIRSVLVVPLACRGRTLGIMTLDVINGQKFFTSKEINVAMGVGVHAAVAVEQFRLLDRERTMREDVSAVTQALGAGLMTVDRNFRILALDPTAESILGWESPEVVGRQCAETFFAVDEAGSAMCEHGCVAHQILDQAKQGASQKLFFRRKDGSRVLCFVRGAPIRDDLDEAVRVVYAIRPMGEKLTPAEEREAPPATPPRRKTGEARPRVE